MMSMRRYINSKFKEVDDDDIKMIEYVEKLEQKLRGVRNYHKFLLSNIETLTRTKNEPLKRYYYIEMERELRKFLK